MAVVSVNCYFIWEDVNRSKTYRAMSSMTFTLATTLAFKDTNGGCWRLGMSGHKLVSWRML